MTYDANGIRRTKFVPTTSYSNTSTYYYDGSKLVKEKIVQANSTQTSTTVRTYLYNDQGVVGFRDTGTVYTYRKNLFGDIISIYNGSTKVAEYAYDAWGNCLVIDPATGLATDDFEFIGHQNPFRYRAYYWDNDLGLYYLMSRYYDPQTGRFINADSLEYLDPETIGGLNLYAYCGNNPVMWIDSMGTDAKWLEWLGLGLLMAICAVAVVVGFLYTPATLIGTVALGAAAGFGAGFLSAASSNLYNQVRTNGFESVDLSQVWSAGFREGAIGAFTGAITAGFAFGFEKVGKMIGEAAGYDLTGSALGRFLNIGVGFYKSVGKAVGIVVGATIGLTIASNILGENENFSDNIPGGISNLLEDLLKSLIK